MLMQVILWLETFTPEQSLTQAANSQIVILADYCIFCQSGYTIQPVDMEHLPIPEGDSEFTGNAKLTHSLASPSHGTVPVFPRRA